MKVASLQCLDDAITTKFLPVLLKRPIISTQEREWLSLPVREGGLGFNRWSNEEPSLEYHNSRRMSGPLSKEMDLEKAESNQDAIAVQIRRERQNRVKELVHSSGQSVSRSQ